jgi:hypothetical protein
MTVECAGGVEKATGNVQPGAVEFAEQKATDARTLALARSVVRYG